MTEAETRLNLKTSIKKLANTHTSDNNEVTKSQIASKLKGTMVRYYYKRNYYKLIDRARFLKKLLISLQRKEKKRWIENLFRYSHIPETN